MTNTLDLVIVGLGLKIPAHVTQEAEYWLTQSDHIFHLVNNPEAQRWLYSKNSSLTDLHSYYETTNQRIDVYKKIIQTITDACQAKKTISVAFYGHPNVFVYPTRELMQWGKKNDRLVLVCPGISAEDCLFADLGIDPARSGCQSYDATDFLLYARIVDPTAVLILWQIGVIGNLTSGPQDVTKGLEILAEALYKYYPPTHRVFNYQSATSSNERSTVEEVALSELHLLNVSNLSTLYVPPIPKSHADTTMLYRLGIETMNQNV